MTAGKTAPDGGPAQNTGIPAVRDELRAMESAYEVLAKLDRPAQGRVLCWLSQLLPWAQDEVPF